MNKHVLASDSGSDLTEGRRYYLTFACTCTVLPTFSDASFPKPKMVTDSLSTRSKKLMRRAAGESHQVIVQLQAIIFEPLSTL